MNANRFFIAAIGMVLFFGLTLCSPAQTVQQEQHVTVKVLGDSKAVVLDHSDGQTGTWAFVASEMGFETKVIKGVPFTADTKTEFIQTLSNGQKIYRKTTGTLARDAEGRTRRDQTVDAIGPYSGTPHQTVFINDPVAGVSYALDPENRIATKTSVTISTIGTGTGATTVTVTSSGMGTVAATGSGWVKSATGGEMGATAEKLVIVDEINRGTAGVMGGVGTVTKMTSNMTFRNESLGTMTIEGFAAEGTRTIETIPAGSIGNNAPIDIVSEKWYAPELGMVVKSTRNDPMSGENIYQILNVRRGEPSPALFQIPADYTVKDGAFMHIQTIKK